MRPEDFRVGVNLSPRPSAADDATAAASAQAAAIATQPLNPTARAVEGFRIAASTTPPGAGPGAQAVADAAANARTALARTDLPPQQAQHLRNVVEHLGNAVIDGKIDPHINNQFREHLYDLATQPAGSDRFNGAMAQMTRAAEVLDRVELARGTQLAYDPAAGQALGNSKLPLLDIPDIDADLYFQTRDGTVHIESTKYGANTLADTLAKEGSKTTSQTSRQAEWQARSTPDAPRATGFYMFDKQADFTALLDPRNTARLEKAIGDADARRVVIGDRAYSVNELKQMGTDAVAKAKTEMPAFRAEWEARNPGQTFAPRSYYQEHMSTPERTMAALGRQYGEPVPTLQRLPQPELPNMRQGAALGGAAAGVVTMITLARNGELSFSKAGEIASHTASGALLGAAAAQGERWVAPVVDRAVGPAAQRAGTSVATRVAGSTAAEAASVGVATRTLATRVAGSTAVGVVISAGVSAYENRQGLARGDSKAIGNVAADTTVGAASVAASVAAGAAIGSVVPVAGTAVGAVVGLAVGVGVAYGAHISGARDAIANTVSGWADSVKGWF
ncbi:hypothetical protein [Ideonella sp. BN130291]|uniref:hypothetical protein n=1 Tax=Ideonella sp. BN130291 TaxID=3112940 RepID=UPI002E272972|nr:hypothetical protein [Ideonella sp. BN130291]